MANLNGILQFKYLGEFDSNNINDFFNDYLPISKKKLKVGNIIKFSDGIHNSRWVVAGINTYFNKGSSGSFTSTNRYALIPYTYLANVNPNKEYGCTEVQYQVMNSTSTTGVSKNPLNPLYATTQGVEMDGYQGYYGSDMNQIHLSNYANNMRSLLGDHMKPIHNLLTDTIDSTVKPPMGNSSWLGRSSNWHRQSIYMQLMSEVEVYGCCIWSSSGYDNGIQNEKLPLFNFINQVQFTRSSYWLRNIASNSIFCAAYSTGGSVFNSAATDKTTVRPLITIGDP